MLTSLIQDKKKENLWQLSILSKPDFYFPVRGSPWKGDKNVGQWTFLSGLLQQTGDGLWSRKDDDNLVPRPQGNNTEVWECQAEQEQWTSAGAVRLFFPSSEICSEHQARGTMKHPMSIYKYALPGHDLNLHLELMRGDLIGVWRVLCGW